MALQTRGQVDIMKRVLIICTTYIVFLVTFMSFKEGPTNKGNLEQQMPDDAVIRSYYSKWLQTRILDLTLPSIHHLLPHTLGNPECFIPTLKMSKGRTNASLVFGIPTVSRREQSYLETTLQSLFDNMSEEEMSQSLIIVMLAEPDPEQYLETISKVEIKFGAFLEAGILEIILPPKEFYPNMSDIEASLGDDLDRVHWRSKQNLDYAFLMMYAQSRGNFYVQLEDDIISKPHFVTTMLNFVAEQKNASHQNWFVIEFSQLGFIGKMFKTYNLPVMIQFLLMFYMDKPVDWLLSHLIQTKICRLDEKDPQICLRAQEAIRIHHKPSLFQHIGTSSSLKGKVQLLKDTDFEDEQPFVPHRNPSAKPLCSLPHYNNFTIENAYTGNTYFWGLTPKPGDFILFSMTPPVNISSIKFASGSFDHPEDICGNQTSVDISFENHAQSDRSNYTKLQDSFWKLGNFDNLGTFVHILNTTSKIAEIRITFNSPSEHWVLLSEIDIKT